MFSFLLGNTLLSLLFLKTSTPSASPTNYRPISLLPIVSKLLEKHVANILLDHFLDNSLISPNQFGFMPSRSTIDALISVIHSIHSHLDCSTPICGIFLDLRKAFDSVCHHTLLNQIFSINLPDQLWHWFLSYLTGALNLSESVRACHVHALSCLEYHRVLFSDPFFSSCTSTI